MLADARHDEPVPPEVAARLDEALAGLRAEEPSDTNVVPLRRRAARLPRYLLAAAAVVAIGYGTTQVIDNTLSGSSGDSGSAGGGVAEDSTVDKDAGSGDSPSAAEGAPPPEAFVPLDELGIEGLEPIRPANLDQDLTVLGDTEEQAGALRSTRRLAATCGPRDRVPGSRTLAAAYDGAPDAGGLPRSRRRLPAGRPLPLRHGDAPPTRSVRSRSPPGNDPRLGSVPPSQPISAHPAREASTT